MLLNSIQGDVIVRVAAPTPRPSATRASSLQASANELFPLLDLLAFLYPYLHIRPHVNQVDCWLCLPASLDIRRSLQGL